MIREPIVADKFYKGNVKYLNESIEDCFKHRLGPGAVPKLSRINDEKKVNAIMVPHAGYVYSGPTAAHAYSKLVQDGYPETFVILCPNHTGFGENVSVYNEGSWVVPNGVCDVDSELANAIIENSNFAKADFKAHIQEHSCEVQLPFLKYFDSNFKIVPICMIDQAAETSKDLANSIIDAILDVLEEFLNGLTPDKLTEIGESIADFINGIDFQPERLADVVNRLFDALLKIAKTATKNVNWREIGEDIGKLLGDIDWESIISGASDVLEGIKNGLHDLLDGALYEAFGEIGRDAIEGFVMALKTLVNAAIGPFKVFLDAVRFLFGIHSPSTVFLEIGTNIVEGFINGIKVIVEQAKEVWEKLKAKTIEIYENIKQKVVEKTTALKDKAIELYENIKTNIKI